MYVIYLFLSAGPHFRFKRNNLNISHSKLLKIDVSHLCKISLSFHNCFFLKSVISLEDKSVIPQCTDVEVHTFIKLNVLLTPTAVFDSTFSLNDLMASNVCT